MVTEDEILLLLSQDSWFKPSESVNKKQLKDRHGCPMKDEDGNPISVAESYYKELPNGTQIIIRVSNHGTDLDTWVRHNPNPADSLQNASVVFSNNTVLPKLKTYKHKYVKDGIAIEGYRYFVVEEFSYNIGNFDIKSVKKILNSIKRLETYDSTSTPLFKDAFEGKPKKRAKYNILEPTDEFDNPIPQSTNPVHPRQIELAASKKNQNESTITKISETALREIIAESVSRVLSEYYNEDYLLEFNSQVSGKRLVSNRVGEFNIVDGDWMIQKVEGIRNMGAVMDARMYASDKPKGEIYCLYFCCRSGKFFFTKLADNGKSYKANRIRNKEVPPIILSDARSLIHQIQQAEMAKG